MKNPLILLVVFILLSASKPIVNTYDLKTAIEKKLIVCKFKGNVESPHYYQPLKIDITNITNKSFVVRIPNGLKFVTDSTDTQDVIITQEEFIVLVPNKIETKPLFAMCIQQYKSASNESTTYQIGEQSTGDLSKLTKNIEENKSFNTLGQYSIWALTDEFPLDEIDGFNEEEANQYQNIVADLLDVPAPATNSNDYKNYYKSTKTYKSSVVGKFKYKFHKQSNITIGMFNEQDIIVRELYNNPTEKAGEHLFNYAFDTETYTDPTYYIRLIVNGEIRLNLKMEPRRRS